MFRSTWYLRSSLHWVIEHGRGQQQQETECLPTNQEPGFTHQPPTPHPPKVRTHQQPHHPKSTAVITWLFLPQNCVFKEMKSYDEGKVPSTPLPSLNPSHPPQSSHCYAFGLNRAHIFIFYSLSIHELCAVLCFLQKFHQGFTINSLLQFAFFHCTLFSAVL